MADEWEIVPPALLDGAPAVEQLRLSTGTPAGVINHYCEHDGCRKWGGFGFAKPKRPSHWFCFEHRPDGERYL